jgi:fructose-specific phosphotransferase system IIC component
VLAVLGVLFAFANWTPITVYIWSGILIDTHLPVLLAAVFLLGLVPPLILHRATRWSLRRKLEAAQRQSAPQADPPLRIETIPPAAAPIAPPPGVA